MTIFSHSTNAQYDVNTNYCLLV